MMLLPRQRRLLADIGIAFGTIAAMYGVWKASKAAFGFQEKTPSQLISELQAEDVRDRSRDSAIAVEQFTIKALTEANTIMLCTMVDPIVKNQSLPCKRLLRERGIE